MPSTSHSRGLVNNNVLLSRRSTGMIANRRKKREQGTSLPGSMPRSVTAEVPEIPWPCLNYAGHTGSQGPLWDVLVRCPAPSAETLDTSRPCTVTACLKFYPIAQQSGALLTRPYHVASIRQSLPWGWSAIRSMDLDVGVVRVSKFTAI